MNAQALIKQMRAQREVNVPLADGKSITLIRPTDLECQRDLLRPSLSKTPGGKTTVELHIDTDKLHHYATGWSGFTEQDLLGPNGASDSVDFDQTLLSEYLANNLDTALNLTNALYEAILAHITAKSAAEKN